MKIVFYFLDSLFDFSLGFFCFFVLFSILLDEKSPCRPLYNGTVMFSHDSNADTLECVIPEEVSLKTSP